MPQINRKRIKELHEILWEIQKENMEQPPAEGDTENISGFHIGDLWNSRKRIDGDIHLWAEILNAQVDTRLDIFKSMVTRLSEEKRILLNPDETNFLEKTFSVVNPNIVKNRVDELRIRVRKSKFTERAKAFGIKLDGPSQPDTVS